MNFTIIIDFTYETKLGTKLTGQMECLDFDDITDIIKAVTEWCEDNGFKMKRIDINRIDKEVNYD